MKKFSVANTFYLFFIAWLLSIQCLFAQSKKVDVSKEMITVDGKDFARIVKEDCKLWMCNYRVTTPAGKAFLYIKSEYYDDAKKATASNPQGRISYMTWNFLTSQAKCETESRTSAKKVAEIIVKNEFLKDSVENDQGIQNFVMINGMHYSKDRDNSGTKVIIIEK